MSDKTDKITTTERSLNEKIIELAKLFSKAHQTEDDSGEWKQLAQMHASGAFDDNELQLADQVSPLMRGHRVLSWDGYSQAGRLREIALQIGASIIQDDEYDGVVIYPPGMTEQECEAREMAEAAAEAEAIERVKLEMAGRIIQRAVNDGRLVRVPNGRLVEREHLQEYLDHHKGDAPMTDDKRSKLGG
jgi:acetyl/propionyl-CoA carboxylase alpha subunit